MSATSRRTEVGAEVQMAIARDPSLVRTVRLVAAAVARRADCPDGLVEEIRLAVGEACAVMIGLDETPQDSREHVEVQIGTADGFTVTVSGRLDSDDSGFGDIGLDPWALLRGISETLEVSDEGGVTTLRMTWPR